MPDLLPHAYRTVCVKEALARLVWIYIVLPMYPISCVVSGYVTHDGCDARAIWVSAIVPDDDQADDATHL